MGLLISSKEKMISKMFNLFFNLSIYLYIYLSILLFFKLSINLGTTWWGCWSAPRRRWSARCSRTSGKGGGKKTPIISDHPPPLLSPIRGQIHFFLLFKNILFTYTRDDNTKQLFYKKGFSGHAEYLLHFVWKNSFF